MITLGLDLSLTGTGVVCLDRRTVRLRRLICTEPLDGPRERRIITISNIITMAARELNVEQVGIEGYAYDKKFGGEVLAEIHGVVKHHLTRMGVPFFLIAPKSLQLFALGFGGYKRDEAKPKMIEAARRAGCVTYDDNVADAYWLARWAQEQTP